MKQKKSPNLRGRNYIVWHTPLRINQPSLTNIASEHLLKILQSPPHHHLTDRGREPTIVCATHFSAVDSLLHNPAPSLLTQP